MSDVDKIDLGSAPAEDFDPFASDDDLGFDDEGDDEVVAEDAPPMQATPLPTPAQAPARTTASALSEQKQSEKTTTPNAVGDDGVDSGEGGADDDTEPENPIAAAIDSAETKDATKASQSLHTKPPMFVYGDAKENIKDTSQTFDELRIAKSPDFPELGDDKKVSWTVEYGKITKAVSDPTGTSIAKMKSDIETSKAFIDALKKSKDKNPTCIVKPKIAAQSKGVVQQVGTSSYKGAYINMEEAEASGKLITLFPAKDGNVYEMRNTQMGKFVTRAANNDLLSEVKAGFTPALPLIPRRHLRDIIGFFKMMAKDGNNEALANIYWDKQGKEFIVDIPQQSASMFHVKGTINPAYDDERYIHYMDIHSHHTMAAFFSAIDDYDEKATRVYAVVGNVLGFFPEIKVRISNGGKFLEIEPSVVFEGFGRVSSKAMMWFEQLQHQVNVFSNLMKLARGHGEDGKPGGDGK